jgi:phospholipase/carboxylesterase
MWAFRRAFPDTCSFIAPQAFLVDEVGGWSWWNVRTEGGANRDAILEAATKVERFLASAVKFYTLAPRKIVVVGFSQGAGLLSVLMQKAPTAFAGVALLAGFVIEIEELPAVSAAPPVFVAHGQEDSVVPPQVCEKGVAFLRARGFPVQLVFDAVGHKVGSGGVRALKIWAEGILG